MKQESAELETRIVKEPKDVAADIADDLQMRMPLGQAIVIAARPSIVHALIKKRWAKLARAVRVEHASTLTVWKRDKFELLTMRMESATFTRSTNRPADVYIVEPSEATPLLAHATTVYVASPMGEADLAKLRSGVDARAVIVRYQVVGAAKPPSDDRNLRRFTTKGNY